MSQTLNRVQSFRLEADSGTLTAAKGGLRMTRTGKWARRAVWGTLVAIFAVGCNPLNTIAFIFHRDAKIPAAYPMTPKEDETTGKKKEEAKVAIFCVFGQVPPHEFLTADRDLPGIMIKKCPEVLKEADGKDKLTFVTAAEVDNFKRANPNWKTMHPTAWGKKLEADYVMEITLSGLQIHQPRSNNQIYEGRAEVTVDVYDVAEAGAAPIHNYVYPYTYPKGMFRSVDSIPGGPNRFKQLYLENLAVEILLMHVEHKPSEGIASDR